MKQAINRAAQKWGVSMTLSFAAVLMAVLPAGYIGTILIVLAFLGLMLSILIGRVIRWLVEE